MTDTPALKPGEWLRLYLIKKRLKKALRRKPRPSKVKEQND